MAGKLHVSYEHDALGKLPPFGPANPGRKLARAYAEGYQAYRSGVDQVDNPHIAGKDPVAGTAWNQGFLDGQAGFPATHVGGPDAEAPLPPDPDPDPDPEEPEPEAKKVSTKRAKK